MAIWIGAACAAVLVVAVAVALLVGRPPSQPAAQPSAGTATKTSGTESTEDVPATDDIDAAVATIIAGEPVTDADQQCLHDALAGDSAMVSAVNTESYDQGELAALMADCISTDSIAATVTSNLSANGETLTATEQACVETSIAALTHDDITTLMALGIEGNSDALLDAHYMIWGACVM